jgi:hypothetical protein
MAKRIPQLDAITGTSTANDDQFLIFDTSTDITKRISRSELALAMGSSLAAYFLPITGGTLTGVLNVVLSSSDAAVRITQTGSGNAITVEDSANPDTTPFVVKADGKVGVGTNTPSVSIDIQTIDAIRMPSGYDGDRPTGAAGLFRYNLTVNNFEGHNGTSWFPIGSLVTGITPISSGTNGRLLFNNSGFVGELALLDVPRGGTGAATLTGYVKGNGTSVMTAAANIPSTDITGLGTMSVQDASAVAITGGTATLTSVALTSGSITTAPTTSNHIVNKSYVDGLASGLSFHTAVQYASTGALPTSTYTDGAPGTLGVGAFLLASSNGALTVDSQSVSVGQRILIKDQALPKENGVYTVTIVGDGGTAWKLTRATDANTAGNLSTQLGAGSYFFVEGGSSLASTSWIQQVGSIVFGTTSITFTKFAAPITYAADGSTLALASSVFSIKDVTGLSAGSYGSASAVPVVTLNTKGQVTAVTNTAISIDTSQVTTGILSNIRGGTGFGSYTTGDILYASATNTLSKLGVGADGTFLKVTSGVPVWGASPFSYPGAGIAVSSGSAWSTSLTAPAGALVGTTATQTLTNKKIVPRVNTLTAPTSVTVNSDDYDVYIITGLNTTSGAPCAISIDGGTPVDGQKLLFRIRDDGTGRYFQFASGLSKSYRWVGMSPQTLTTAGKTLYLGAFYNAAATPARWDFVAIAQEA